jgi:mannonate dehydratase
MLHLNMSIPNCAVQEYGPPPPWMEDVTPYDYQVEGGYLFPSDSPGLGIDLNEEAAAAHPYVHRENTHLRREDGSVQDW